MVELRGIEPLARALVAVYLFGSIILDVHDPASSSDVVVTLHRLNELFTSVGPVDAEVFRSHTDLLLSVGTFLYGRRLYETMAVWETDATLAAQSDLFSEFATAWQTANKVVYSTTLTAASTTNTRIENHFDPTAVRELKTTASSDITVGGANLASQAFKAELVDECQLFVWPTILGGGKLALPTDARTDLELIEQRRFGNGVAHLRYRPLKR